MKTFASFKEVILLLKQHHVQPFKQQTRASEKKSKLLLLYEGIADNKFSSDDEAFSELYGSSAENSNYRKLKSDLQDRLLDSVLTIKFEQDHYSDYQKAYYDAHRQWVTVKFLIGQNANSAGLVLAQKLLRQSEKFDFTLLSMDIASYLRVQFGLRESNDKRYVEANRLFELYHAIYTAESSAEELYTSLVVRIVNKRTALEEVRSLAKTHYERIQVEMQRFETYKLQMYGYLIGLKYHTASNNYKIALEICDAAISFFEHRLYEPRVPLQIFYYQKMLFNIHVGKLLAAQESIGKCLAFLEDGTFNYFKFNELYLVLLLHTHEFEKAENLLISNIEHPRFEFLPDNAKELWRIYESYISYLALLGKIDNASSSKFKLGKFINEVPIFSKDKGGMNIAILIIKFLYLLVEKKYSRAIDEVEPIEQYCYRHLRTKNTKRSYLFFKMLVHIPTCQFEVEKIESKVARFKEQLKTTPLQLANQTYEIEIIPYERLWELAIESIRVN